MAIEDKKLNLSARRRVLNAWTAPVVLAVVLPEHAAASANLPEPSIQVRDLELDIKIQSCANRVINVEVCNKEPFHVLVTSASVEIPLNRISGLTFRSPRNPPFIAPSGGCVQFVFFARFSDSFDCEPPWILRVSGRSDGPVGEVFRIEGSASAPF